MYVRMSLYYSRGILCVLEELTGSVFSARTAYANRHYDSYALCRGLMRCRESVAGFVYQPHCIYVCSYFCSCCCALSNLANPIHANISVSRISGICVLYSLYVACVSICIYDRMLLLTCMYGRVYGVVNSTHLLAGVVQFRWIDGNPREAAATHSRTPVPD